MTKTELLNKLARDGEERMLLARVLDKLEPARNRDGPGHTGAGIARRVHDFRHSLVQDAVIVSLELDTDTITANCRHCESPFFRQPAPAVPDGVFRPENPPPCGGRSARANLMKRQNPEPICGARASAFLAP